MDDLTLTTTDYSSYITQAQTSQLTSQLKQSASTDATDDELLEACKEFEEYMIEQLIKQAQSTIKSDDDEDESGYEEYAYDLQAQQYAQAISEQGSFGLAQQLYENMKVQNAAITPEELHAQQTDSVQTADVVSEESAGSVE